MSRDLETEPRVEFFKKDMKLMGSSIGSFPQKMVGEVIKIFKK